MTEAKVTITTSFDMILYMIYNALILSPSQAKASNESTRVGRHQLKRENGDLHIRRSDEVRTVK